ncbi:MAG TPA: amino acid ABC transporter permease [Methanocorpusculum sp.]|nr:amino acid ABC transporter permease [Methanocorpusculum sp.]
MNKPSMNHLPVRIAGAVLLILFLVMLCVGCVSAETADTALANTTAVATQTADVAVTAASNPVTEFFTSLGDKFTQNFLNKGRYSYIIEGLQNTAIIALCALLIGLVFGTLIAIVRTVHDLHGKLNILNAICKLYLTIIRGTPVLVQLLIIYYVIFATVDLSKILIASIAFGINSAAYVAEIIRAGINAVPKGQFEAGFSLGLPFRKTMTQIILPQAIKNILPALCNEGITLIKETSVSGYIGVMDLTKAGDLIRSQTFEPFLPLLAVAVIYLAMVMILTAFVNKLEKRLNQGNGMAA